MGYTTKFPCTLDKQHFPTRNIKYLVTFESYYSKHGVTEGSA